MRVSHNYLRQQFDDVTINAILVDLKQLARSGDFTMGQPMKDFERRFSAEFVNGRPIVAVNSGTEALILALKAVGIGPGDEVVVPSNSFYASAGSIVAVGARPVLADVDETYSLDASRLETTRYNRAVIPVWWGGMPPDWSALRRVAPGAAHIEDACQGIGGSYEGTPAGCCGDIAAVSFHPIKTLHGWGDGGAVICDYYDTAHRLRRYRDHGKMSRDEIIMWGVNAKLPTMQAVVLLHVMDAVKAATKRRQEIADRLDAGLRDVPGVIVPPRDPRRQSSWRLYMVQCEERERLMDHLGRAGVEALIHYPVPLHLQAPGRALGYGPGDFPVAEAQAKRVVSLPCHEYLGDDDVDYVIESVRGFYGA